MKSKFTGEELDTSPSRTKRVRSVETGIVEPTHAPTSFVSELARVYHLTTEIERDVWYRVAQGLTTKEIAAMRNRSVKTVDFQISILFKKLGCKSRVDLTRAAVRYRITEIEVLPSEPEVTLKLKVV